MHISGEFNKHHVHIWSKSNAGNSHNFDFQSIIVPTSLPPELVRKKRRKTVCVWTRAHTLFSLFNYFLNEYGKIEFAKQPFPRHLIKYNPTQICIQSVSLDSRLNDNWRKQLSVSMVTSFIYTSGCFNTCWADIGLKGEFSSPI